MRFFSQLQTGLLLAGVAQTVLGQSASQSDVDATTNATAVEAAKEAAKAAAALLASMPDCGRTCLVSGIAASPCDLTDIACSCGNATITQQVELCVTERCMVKEQLSSKNATSTLCSLPVRDETHIVSWAGVIGGILAVIAYAMRMISRLPRFGGTLGWDDLAITLAIVEIIPLTVFSVLLANLGLGKDIWTVPFDNITMILKIYYFDEDLYLTALPLVKISILLFYLRIFPQDWFRYSCFAAMAACAGYGIAFLLVSVFQCIPINYAWLNWDGEHTGTCNDINAQGWTSAAFNVILDVVVLALPMPVITKLELNKRKKFFILLMFSVGFVVTVVSILRLQVLVQFGGTTNFTWHYRSVGYWSTSEINLAVICACMPGVRAMIAWVLPRVMGDTTAAKSTAKSGFGSSYDASASGPSIVKRSRPSRDLFDKSDKDFIPLVEVTDTNGSKGASKSKDRWSMEA